MRWVASTSLVSHGDVPLLTSYRDWAILKFELAIEDIRAFKYRGTTGSLGSMKEVSETPSTGAKLITRRPKCQVRPLLPK
jgi:hypothetical protein